MARLSYEERIKRLEARYNELVKPVFIVAESNGDGVDAVTILSNGKKNQQFFESKKAFSEHIKIVENCNIIADKKIMSWRDAELTEALEKADAEDLKRIVSGQASPDVIERVLYVPISSKFIC